MQLYNKLMSEWMKLIECKQTPDHKFTLYDYTKIAYPIDSAICLRQIMSEGQKPAFIPIDHEYDQILEICAIPNQVVTIEVYNFLYTAYFYENNGNFYSVRMSWELQGELFIRSIVNNGVLIVVASSKLGNQAIFIDCKRRTIVGRGLFEKPVKQIRNGPYQSLSVLTMKGEVIVYAFEELEKGIGRVYKDRSYTQSKYIQKHCWVEEELIVIEGKEMRLIIDENVCQVIKDFFKPCNVLPILCGVIVLDGSVIKVFKRMNSNYDLIAEINDPNLINCENPCLSPQEDIFAYFSPRSSSIIYNNNFSQQIHEASLQQSSEIKSVETLKSFEIAHRKSFQTKIYGSRQSWFVITNGPEIVLYSTTSYEPFLTIKITKEGEQNSLLGSEIHIRSVAVHPSLPIIAVAYDKKIRIYLVTFHQAKVLKDIPVSQAKNLFFNHSGSILLSVVRGKSGTKAYLHRISEVENDFSLIESITVGKNVNSFSWSANDSFLYGFHNQGYFEWSISTNFKIRNEVNLKFDFEVEGGFAANDESLIVWGFNEINLIKNSQIEQSIKSVDEIRKVQKINGIYIFMLENGKICKNKNFDIEECFPKAIDLKTKGNWYEIQALQNNKFIVMTHENNLRFYEWAKPLNENPQYTVIERKKIVKMMKEYNQYEEKIKLLSLNLHTSMEELKYDFEKRLKDREEEYRKQLEHRIKAEKLLKDEKVKLQIEMERNLNIKEKQAMKQVKDLERLYERKIALTTNKLITTSEMAFRDKLIRDQNLKELEVRHNEDIQEIRQQYTGSIKKSYDEKDQTKQLLLDLKKQYELRLYEMEQENELLLRQLQDKNDEKVSYLRKSIVEWEHKYSECISKKDNVDQQLHEELINIEILKEKIAYLQMRKMESDRKGEYANQQIKKLQGFIEDRNKIIECYDQRIDDLQKSNQILKYRVHELKSMNDPQEEQINSLKDNLIDLEEEHEKIEKKSYEQEQVLDIVKKERNALKESNNGLIIRLAKLDKTYDELVSKVREATKLPFQTIRKEVLGLVERYSKKQTSQVRKLKVQSPLGQLNRIRDHLQVCLDSVVSVNKKSEEQKKKQIRRKNLQNSQLLIELNALRRKIGDLETELKEKDRKLQSISKADKSITKITHKQYSQTQSKELTRTKARDSFYEKNLFKSYWKDKRLKTEEGSRRKKSTYSMIKDKSHYGPLLIQADSDDVEEYKRIIEQKDIFIQRLIAKLQNN